MKLKLTEKLKLRLKHLEKTEPLKYNDPDYRIPVKIIPTSATDRILEVMIGSIGIMAQEIPGRKSGVEELVQELGKLGTKSITFKGQDEFTTNYILAKLNVREINYIGTANYVLYIDDDSPIM